MTLNGPNQAEVEKCRQKIQSIVSSWYTKIQLNGHTDLIDWSQQAIRSYYDYCLRLHVLPNMEITSGVLTLEGLKDHVICMMIEREFNMIRVVSF